MTIPVRWAAALLGLGFVALNQSASAASVLPTLASPAWVAQADKAEPKADVKKVTIAVSGMT